MKRGQPSDRPHELAGKASETFGPKSFPGGWIFLIGLIGLLLLLFRNVLLPGQTLFCTDDNAGFVRYQQSLFPEILLGGWYDQVRVGVPFGYVATIFTPLMWLLPATVYVWAIYAIYIFLGSLFFGLFLKERGCAWPAALLGSIAAFFVGTNFTIIYAGHVQKFAILMNSALYLWLLELMARTRLTRFAILAGGAMAFSFLHQMDVAFFFAIFLAAYTIHVWFREKLFAIRPVLRLALPLGVIALATMLHALRLVQGVQIEGMALETETQEHKWDLATQWSWPPDEIIDAVAPGYFGRRSGDPDAPYYGRVGRSPDWIPRPYWSPNHKAESVYIGLLPAAFCLAALWLAWTQRRREPKIFRDICFWTGALIIALLLSFGRYAPFYAFLYKLPYVSEMRNPNKFVQVVQFALAILAAHGLALTLQTARSPERRAAIKPLIHVFFGLAAVFSLASFSTSFQETSTIAHFRAMGWPDSAAQAIAATRTIALWHATIIGFTTAALILALMLLNANRKWFKILAWAASLLVACDACLLARHYVKTTGTAYYEKNELLDALSAGDQLQRSLMTHQADFYNHWLTFYFPYHHLITWNTAQMPREPLEYRIFRSALQSDQNMRLWQFCAVGHILTPVAYREHMAKNDPAWRDDLELQMAYKLLWDPEREFRMIPAKPDDQSAQGVYRFKRPAPRFALLGQWQEADDKQSLSCIASTNFEPLSCALVAPDSNLNLPQPSGMTQATVSVQSHRASCFRLTTQSDGPAILRFAEKHDPNWRARIDGRPAQLLRVDYLFQGLFLPAGKHEVQFQFMPKSALIWIQLAAMLLWLGFAIFSALAALKSSPKPHVQPTT